MQVTRSTHPPAMAIASWAILAATLLAALAFVTLPARAAPRDVEGGSLSWGIRASFRNYITGPIAHGSVTLGGGASTNPDGTYLFPAVSGSYDPATGALTARFAGSVHFLGHDYGNGPLLNLTFSNFRVEASGTTGMLVADAVSAGLESANPGGMPGDLETFTGVALANLSGISPSLSGASVTVSGVTAALAPGGDVAFAGFYAAGEPLDPVAFTLQLAPEATPTATATPETPAATATTPVASATAIPTSSPSATPATVPPSTVTPVPVEDVVDPGDLDPAVAPVSVILESGQTAMLVGPSDEPLISASFVDPSGGTGAVLLARYADGWVPAVGAVLGAGGRAYDVYFAPSSGVGPNATLTVTLNGLTPGQPLVWWDGNSWLPVSSAGAPVNANSAGQATVVFGPASSPTLGQLTGTPIGTKAAASTPTPAATATSSSTPVPSATTQPPAATLTATAIASPPAQPTSAAANPTPRPPATGSGTTGPVSAQWLVVVSVLVVVAGLGSLSAARSHSARGHRR